MSVVGGVINMLRVLISIRPVAGVAGEGCIGVNAEVGALFQDGSDHFKMNYWKLQWYFIQKKVLINIVLLLYCNNKVQAKWSKKQ